MEIYIPKEDNMVESRLRFSGKRVIITGASKGIGRAAAIRFTWEGTRVMVTGFV
jgi:NAD(P)-dependent dehydrogenase (short-subunit alcohol dehydrogenase family)